jgi:hypothetical protein
VKEQQREQACDLRRRRPQFVKRPYEPEREPAEVAADRRLVVGRPVTFVEQQVKRAQHRVEAIAGLVGRWCLVVAAIAKASAGADEALLHRARRDQEGLRDLRVRPAIDLGLLRDVREVPCSVGQVEGPHMLGPPCSDNLTNPVFGNCDPTNDLDEAFEELLQLAIRLHQTPPLAPTAGRLSGTRRHDTVGPDPVLLENPCDT